MILKKVIILREWCGARANWECQWCGSVHEKPEAVLPHEMKVHGKHKQHDYFKLKESANQKEENRKISEEP